MSLDLCKSGEWDINPAVACPVCGALPDTDCQGRVKAETPELKPAMATMTDDEIRKEWQLAKGFHATVERLRFGYRPVGWSEAPGFHLANRLLEGSIARLEHAGVTDADIDRVHS